MNNPSFTQGITMSVRHGIWGNNELVIQLKILFGGNKGRVFREDTPLPGLGKQ